ncbi:MAG: hypothetical protein NZO58_06265 [Gemmataceae bacterium]|nr:hypothetical protein [Gemmataceae bacterium]
MTAPLSLLNPILTDELLTRGLGDAEARAMIEWLVDRSEQSHARLPLEVCRAEITRLCQRARAVSRFVHLWCYQQLHGAACQLAATERFTWPLPATDEDPYEVMNQILEFETVEAQQRLELLAV